MGPSALTPEDLDVRDPREMETERATLARHMGVPAAALTRLCHALLAPGRRLPPRFRLSFDEALAVAACNALATVIRPAGDAALAVRAGWPELAGAFLSAERGRPDAGAPAPAVVLVSGGLAPPAHLRIGRPGAAPPAFSRSLELQPVTAAMIATFGRDGWERGLRRLDRLFGPHNVTLPREANLEDLPRGTDFLSEGPYWRRLEAFLAADVTRLFGSKGPVEAARLRHYAEYLLEPPPIDQFKREAGSARLMPRIKHLVEAVADQAGMDLRARRHPEVLKNVDAVDACRTLLGHLRSIEKRGLLVPHGVDRPRDDTVPA